MRNKYVLFIALVLLSAAFGIIGLSCGGIRRRPANIPSERDKGPAGGATTLSIQPRPSIFDAATKTVYIPKCTEGKFDWLNQDTSNWFTWPGKGIDFLEEGSAPITKEIVWHGRGTAGLASWLAFDKNQDIIWSADCKMNSPPDVATDCGIVFYHQEMYYARLLLERNPDTKQIFLAAHHLRSDRPMFWSLPDNSRDWRNTWVNYRFDWNAKTKLLRLYRNNELFSIASGWDVSQQPHPVMHLQNWVDDARAEYFLKNITISKGDLGCWSLSATRMAGQLAGVQITTENLEQKAPADAPGSWFLKPGAVTGTLITPFIKIHPDRSFKCVRISSDFSEQNQSNELRLSVRDEKNNPISDMLIPGNSQGLKIPNGVWEGDLSKLTHIKTLRFQLKLFRDSDNVISPVFYWMDLDTAQQPATPAAPVTNPK